MDLWLPPGLLPGQRLYNADALTALARIRLLRKAGFSLGEIHALMEKETDAATLIAAHIDTLRAEARAINEAITALEDVAARLDAGEQNTIDLLCKALAASAACETGEQWRSVLERYFSSDAQEDWMAMREKLRASVDPEAYDRDWNQLAEEIEAALPLDPMSSTAQEFLDRWNALLAPFRAVASQEQQKAAAKMWSNVGQWRENVNHPMTQSVVDFIIAASKARTGQRKSRGNLDDG